MHNCSWKRNSYPKSSVLPIEFFDHARTNITHLDPVLDHFGAATVAIPGIFGFRSEIATCFSTEPVSEPVPMAVYGVLLDLHVSKSSA